MTLYPLFLVSELNASACVMAQRRSDNGTREYKNRQKAHRPNGTACLSLAKFALHTCF